MSGMANFALRLEIYYIIVLIKLVFLSTKCLLDNQYACLNELYNYDMHCPPEFQSQQRQIRKQDNFDKDTFTPEYLRKANKHKNTICILKQYCKFYSVQSICLSL